KKSVQQMKLGKADFSDYLINQINQQAGCAETVTFDAKLQKLAGIRLL
ncbi:MAG: twitching motility protein PilT, partial [Nostocaceae cyanobacterium]|nr:twitching motility protein PilT [Nostocaceae cyanobacterium]